MRSALGSELKSAEAELKNSSSVAQTETSASSSTAESPDESAIAAASEGDSGKEIAEGAGSNPARKSGSMYTAWMPPADKPE